MTQSFKHTVEHDYLLPCIIKAKTERRICSRYFSSTDRARWKGKKKKRKKYKKDKRKKKRTRRRSYNLIALDDAILRLDRGRLPLYLQLDGRHRVDPDILRGHGGSWEIMRGNSVNTRPTVTTHCNTGSIQQSQHEHTYWDVQYLLQKTLLHKLNANTNSAAP